MIIDTQEAVLMHEDDDLAASLMGGIWEDFKVSIPEPQAKILIKAFNLILLTCPDNFKEQVESEDDTIDVNGYDTLLPNTITELLVDDTTHIPEKKNAVFQLITSNIIDNLVRMGFTLDEDEACAQTLVELTNLGQLFFDLDQYEDLIGLADLLDSRDIPPKERFLLLMEKYLGEQFDLDIYERLILDVSEVTLIVIRNALLQEDNSEILPVNIVKRVVDNKALLEGTLAFDHIRNNGQLGGSVQSFMSFFSRELEALTDNPTEENLLVYGKQVVALYLISEMNTPKIKDSVLRYLSDVITDYTAMIKIENFIHSLVLTDD